ncbi:MAG: CaiB/BaiF CoA transferase family protein [Reyranellaceae bacterium]
MLKEPGPLHGVRVLDFTQMLAGPYCSMIFADLGAEVLKVEFLEGDRSRRLGPFPPANANPAFGGYFQSINCGKKSIAINLKEKKGRETILALAKSTDLILENFRPGVMERLGLSYESFKKINPRIVYGAVRGFGDPRTGKSPYADWPCFDVIAQAMGGLVGGSGPDEAHPSKAGPSLGDIIPGLFLAIGVLAAYRHAQLTGEGQFVDVSMYDSVISVCERLIHQFSYTGMNPAPEGNHHPLVCPFGIFPANDGFVSIACPDPFWATLAQIIDGPGLANNQNFITNEQRLARRQEVLAIVSEWTSLHSRDELKDKLGGHVPFGPVNSAQDIVSDLHAQVRSMIVEMAHPGSVQKTFGVANTPIRMTATPSGHRFRSPMLGEHTEEILRAAGHMPRSIETLRKERIIL